MPRLENAQVFPSLQLPSVGGGTLSLPDDLADHYAVVLTYRGAWCPSCNAQLSAFARAQDKLDAADIKVIAFSVDDEEATSNLVEKRKLNFPVGYGADPDDTAATLGCYLNDEPRYLQPSGFVLAPDGTVIVAVYSSGAIGRLMPEEVIGMVNHVKDAA